jgi:transcriptional regulator with XRE-family HTH domain
MGAVSMSAVNSNIVSGRQLRAARMLAGLTQAQLSTEAGFGPRAAKYWERWGDDLPTTIATTLEAIEAVLLRHGVEVFSDPSPGCCLVSMK